MRSKTVIVPEIGDYLSQNTDPTVRTIEDLRPTIIRQSCPMSLFRIKQRSARQRLLIRWQLSKSEGPQFAIVSGDAKQRYSQLEADGRPRHSNRQLGPTAEGKSWLCGFMNWGSHRSDRFLYKGMDCGSAGWLVGCDGCAGSPLSR